MDSLSRLLKIRDENYKGAVSLTVLNGFKWENFHQLGEALFKSDTLFTFTARHENASKLGWRLDVLFSSIRNCEIWTRHYDVASGSALWPVQLAKEKIYFFVEVLLLLWRTGKSRKIFHGFHLSRNMRVKELRNVYYLS